MAKKKKNKGIVMIYLLLVAVLCTVIYLLPKVNESMTQTFLAENGTLQVSENTQGYIVRNEIVYLAGTSGKTDYKVKEGKRVKKTAVVMKVKEETVKDEKPGFTDLIDNLGKDAVSTKQYRAGINGVVSYEVDGFENIFKVADISEIKYKDVGGIKSKASSLKRERVIEGEPVYKVYDNSQWYMVIWTDAEHSKNYKKGNPVTIEFSDAAVKASVHSVKKQGNDEYRVILKSDRYYKDLAIVRSTEVRIISQEATGVILDNSSITEKDGTKGVYVKDTAGDYGFVPVNVLLSNDSQSVASESYFYDADGDQIKTVELYDEVLRKP